MSVIEIQNLTRDYGGNRGIYDLSFSVGSGEVFGFLGPNGAGKTTTIRHLMGLLRPKQGCCRIFGLDCWTSSEKIQEKLGYIPGEMAYFDDMTGDAFLRFIIRYRGMKDSGRMKELIDRFELDASGKLSKMSKGMKQKVGIVAAFLHDPDVLILDEPTSGLDPLMQNRFIELILEEKARGKTILMSSHMFEEVERTCHRVGIIREGRLVAVDEVERLKEQQVQKYTVIFETESAISEFIKEEIDIVSSEENRVTVLVHNDFKKLISILNRYPVKAIMTPGQNLEEIFLHYYGGENHE